MADRRMTLVARDLHKPDIDWNYRAPKRAALAFTESTAAVRYALGAGTNLGFDVGRVIVDRTGTADDFLELLTELTTEYTGDALLIRDDGSGVLAATGRCGDRILHSLTVHDVRFYLEAHDLVTGRVAIELTA